MKNSTGTVSKIDKQHRFFDKMGVVLMGIGALNMASIYVKEKLIKTVFPNLSFEFLGENLKDFYNENQHDIVLASIFTAMMGGILLTSSAVTKILNNKIEGSNERKQSQS